MPYTQTSAPVARQAVSVRVVAREGDPLTMEWHLMKRPEIVVDVISPSALEKAQNRGISKEYLEEQLGRLGNTAYVLAGSKSRLRARHSPRPRCLTKCGVKPWRNCRLADCTAGTPDAHAR